MLFCMQWSNGSDAEENQKVRAVALSASCITTCVGCTSSCGLFAGQICRSASQLAVTCCEAIVYTFCPFIYCHSPAIRCLCCGCMLLLCAAPQAALAVTTDLDPTIPTIAFLITGILLQYICSMTALFHSVLQPCWLEHNTAMSAISCLHAPVH